MTLNKCLFNVLFFFLAFAMLLPALDAENKNKMDNYLKLRAQKSFKEAQKAYNPNPKMVTNGVSESIGR